MIKRKLLFMWKKHFLRSVAPKIKLVFMIPDVWMYLEAVWGNTQSVF